MNNDVFTEGVKPGGLKSRKDIKLAICYMLSKIEAGLTKKDIINILQDNNLANYFEIADAFEDLLENNNIYLKDIDDNLYTVTKSGKMISEQLDISLPISIREQVLAATLNLLSKIKRERENKVEIKKIANGYMINCHISGGDLDLMSIKLYAPDIMQATLIKKNFHKNPELIYSCMLALMTNNEDMLKEIIKSI